MNKRDKMIFLLQKDHSIDIINGQKKLKLDLIKNCKYMMIPLTEYDTNAYILVKPVKEMKFTKAVIEYQLSIEDYSFLDNCYNFDEINNKDNFNGNEFDYSLHMIHKELFNLVDLYNFIHSISRLEYVNLIYNYDCPFECKMDFKIKYFKITIFNDNEVIYSSECSINLQDEQDTFADSTVKVMDSLKEIVKYVNISNKIDQFLCVNSNKWYIKEKNELENTDLIGIPLNYSYSVFFLNKEIFGSIDQLDRLEVQMNIYDRKDAPKEIFLSKDILDNAFDNEDIDVYFSVYYRCNQLETIVEFMVYCKMISLMITIMYRYVLYDNQNHNSSETECDIDVYTKLSIFQDNGLYNQETHIPISYTKDDIPNFFDITRKIIKGGG